MDTVSFKWGLKGKREFAEGAVNVRDEVNTEKMHMEELVERILCIWE